MSSPKSTLTDHAAYSEGRLPWQRGELLRNCHNCGTLAFAPVFGVCPECRETTEYGREARARHARRRVRK